MSGEDALYEIATTDAWRHLMATVTEAQSCFEKEVLAAARRTNFDPIEVARCSGRVDAIEQLASNLRRIGKKNA